MSDYPRLEMLRRGVETWNAWRKDHGGVEGEEEATRRLVELDAELSRVRAVIEDTFDEVQLVLPRTATYSEGTYSNSVDVLKGSRSLFREGRVETTIPLDMKRV
jgi:hypothetical protein